MLQFVAALVGFFQAAGGGACAARVDLDAVFVIHHPANVERKVRLSTALSAQNLTSRVRWIEAWSAVELAALERTDPDAYARFYDPYRFLREGEREHYCLSPGRMTPRHLSLALKQWEALKAVAETPAIGAALILEDDAMLGEGFVAGLDAYVQEAHRRATCSGKNGDAAASDGAGWDIVSVGAGNPEAHVETEALSEGVHLYRRSWTRGPIFAVSPSNVFRSPDAYVVSHAGARRLVARLLPFAFPFDNQLCYLLNTERATAAAEAGPETQLPVSPRVWWAEPTLVTQGSLAGLFASGLTGRNSFWPAAERVAHFEEALRAAHPAHAQRHLFELELATALAAERRHAEARALLLAVAKRRGGVGGGVSLPVRLLADSAQRYSRAGEPAQAVEYLVAAQLAWSALGAPPPGEARRPLQRYLPGLLQASPEWAGSVGGRAEVRAMLATAAAAAAGDDPLLFALPPHLLGGGGGGGGAGAGTLGEPESDLE